MPTRKNFTPKRERTRAQLIDIAAELIAAEGFDRLSLRDLAARAGVTKGAIYGIFESKGDLFLQVAAEKLSRPRITFEPGLSAKAQMRYYGERVAAAVPAFGKNARLSREFDHYLSNNPELMRNAAEGLSQADRDIAEGLKAVLADDDLPMPVEDFAVLLAAMTGGLLFRRMMMPKVVTDDLIVRCFEALVDDERDPAAPQQLDINPQLRHMTPAPE